MLILLGLLLTPVRALALNAVPAAPCPGLIGCGGGSSNVPLAAIDDLAMLMILIAGGGGVLFIAWAGLQMVLSLGNDGKLGEQKTAVAYVLGGILLASMSQLLVSTIGTDSNLNAISTGNDAPLDVIAGGVNIILTVFNTFFVAAIIIGGIRMVYAQGKSDEYNTGRKIIFWSIVGAIITNLANAIVQAFAGLLGV